METSTVTSTQPTAAMIAIGDELLNGRTRDENIYHLAQWLDARGVALSEVRIVADNQQAIVDAVNALRHQMDYVFTSGGIGPTHDDITADAIGVAVGSEVIERDDALTLLKTWHAAKDEQLTVARRRMARVPLMARLIENSVTGAPGFAVENVYVMAGVPAIFNAMLDTLDNEIARGPIYSAYTVIGPAMESRLADGLEALEVALKGLKIGSYPGKSGTSGQLAIVCKAFDEGLARRAASAVEGLFLAQGSQPQTVKGIGPELE